MKPSQELVRDAVYTDLHKVLDHARSIMPAAEVARIDAHWKMVMDRFSHEDGTPRAFKPLTVAYRK